MTPPDMISVGMGMLTEHERVAALRELAEVAAITARLLTSLQSGQAPSVSDVLDARRLTVSATEATSRIHALDAMRRAAPQSFTRGFSTRARHAPTQSRKDRPREYPTNRPNGTRRRRTIHRRTRLR
jgi:hypothetical protein